MNTNSDTEESLAEAIQTLAYQVKCLGLNGAATPMGATELLAMEIKEAGSKISWGLESVTRALEELKEILESKQ